MIAEFCILLLGSLLSPVVHADWAILPESRQHLFQTYANFVDQQNMLAWRGTSQYWATVNGNLPLFGDNDSVYHPQVILHLSGNDSMRVNDGGGVLTEVLDTRVGFDFQFALPEYWGLRFSFGVQHESGHTVDGTSNPELNELNLGDNTLRLQAYRDFLDQIRLGILVTPVVNSIPPGYRARASVMVDYFPLGSSEELHRFMPFISGFLDHRATSFAGRFTVELHAGIATGTHFHSLHTHNMRFVVGYYNGSDPRAKYAQYDFLRSEFGFLAFIFNL